MFSLFFKSKKTIYLIFIAFLSCNGLSAQELTAINVQLGWKHQSQFSGFYIAKARRYFEKEGLDVRLIEGGPGINAIKELQKGNADIAVSSLSLALATYDTQAPVINIGQIFPKSASTLLCLASRGVYSPEDIEGKTIAIFGESDRRVINEVIQRIGISQDSVKLIMQSRTASDLIDGKTDCESTTVYDGYWSVIERGTNISEILLVSPEDYGVTVLGDGIYVIADDKSRRIDDQKLVGFLRALRHGWHDVVLSPYLALEVTMQESRELDRHHQQHEIESIISLLPKDFDDFGYLDLGMVGRQIHYLGKYGLDENMINKIWTHSFWNKLTEGARPYSPLSKTTIYYLEEFIHNKYFKLLVYFGVFSYALSGTLEAINRGYDLWGRTVLAFLSGIGGGSIRDLIIGGDRLPFYYVKDFVYPLGIIFVVIGASLVAAKNPLAHKSPQFLATKKYSDIFGFSALAVIGSSIALASNIPWYWSPALGALTCAGGGALRDVIINQEPSTFRGVIYEEAAILGSLIMIWLLYICSKYEHESHIVSISIYASMASIILMRILIYRYNIKYPSNMRVNTIHDH